MGSWDAAQQPEATAPVRAIRQLPDGPIHWLRDLVHSPAPEHSLRIGKAEYSDIPISDNEYVANTHCWLLWSGDRLEVRDFAPGKLTKFNGVSVVDGHVLLSPGDVLTIGTKKRVTRLVVLGDDINQRPRIPVEGIPELVVESPAYHGSMRQSAKAIGMNQTTFLNKYKKFVPSVVLCLCIVGGGVWLAYAKSGQGKAADVRTVPAAPAGAVQPVTAPAGAETTDISLDESTKAQGKKRAKKLRAEKSAGKLRPVADASTEARKKARGSKKKRIWSPETVAPTAPEMGPKRPDWVMSSVKHNDWRPPHRVIPANDKQEGEGEP